MKTLTREICRLEIETSQGQLNITDKITNAKPDFNRAVDMVFQLAFVWNKTEMVDIADYASIRIEIKTDADPNAEPVMAKTIVAADFSGNAAITMQQWNDGTHQHADVNFSKSETALALGGAKEKTFWLIVKVTTSVASGSNEFVAGTQQITVKETGYNSGVAPRAVENLVPSGATYNGSGIYTLSGLTVGKVYKFTLGTLTGFDNGLVNGAEMVYESQNFTAQATSVTLLGEAGKGVGSVVWNAAFLTVDESDARYSSGNFGIKTPTFPGWDTWVVNGPRRAIVNVSLLMFYNDSFSRVTLIIQDHTGTWSHYETANGVPSSDGFDTRLLSFPLSPGAKWKLQNTTDPDEANSVASVRVSEF